MTGYFIHPTSIIDDGAMIGDGCRIWHFSHIMGDTVLGASCNIGQNVMIASGARLGNNVKVQNNVSVYSGVTCEDDVFLGPSCVFTNIKNPRSAVSRRGKYERTRVRKGATIGANATVGCGIEIGKYAFICAGAVVTKSVPAYARMMGVPARQTGWMSRCGCKLVFDEKGEAVCDESGLKYVLKEGTVYEVEQ